MLGRVVHSADFRRLLAMPSCSRSAHFALHHADGRPGAPLRGADRSGTQKLSTSGSAAGEVPVNNHQPTIWLGTVLPKRHARRAVTRNLLRRQIRVAMLRHAPGLPAGMWIVRLRSAFDKSQFHSAASVPLRQAARAELDALLARVGRPEAQAS